MDNMSFEALINFANVPKSDNNSFSITYNSVTYSGVHVTLEALIKDKELTSIIKDLVLGSGRSHPGKHAEKQVIPESAIATTEKKQIASGKEKAYVATPLNGVPRKEAVAVPN